MKSNHTKKAQSKLWILRAVDWALLFLPLLVYVCIALGREGVATPAKVGVVGTVAVAAILTVLNILLKKHLRSPMWIILLGLFFAMRQWLLPLIIMLAIATVIDEFILSPAIEKARTALIANQAIDARGE